MAHAVRFDRALVFDLASGGETVEFTSFVVGDGYHNLVAASPEGRWTWWGRVIVR